MRRWRQGWGPRGRRCRGWNSLPRLTLCPLLPAPGSPPAPALSPEEPTLSTLPGPRIAVSRPREEAHRGRACPAAGRWADPRPDPSPPVRVFLLFAAHRRGCLLATLPGQGQGQSAGVRPLARHTGYRAEVWFSGTKLLGVGLHAPRDETWGLNSQVCIRQGMGTRALTLMLTSYRAQHLRQA